MTRRPPYAPPVPIISSPPERCPGGAVWVQHTTPFGVRSVLELPPHGPAGEALELWHVAGRFWQWRTERGVVLCALMAWRC